jgi:tryptophan 2,3-dioxygenase
MVTARSSDRVTYGSYLRVPELLQLQTPLQDPPVHGEMLFIIGQQAQELWFRQILWDLPRIIDLCRCDDLVPAATLVGRLNKIVHALCAETEILETLPPHEFHEFRRVFKTASGFESQQFRELEIACGLRNDEYMKLTRKLVDADSIRARWPISLDDALLDVLRRRGDDPVRVLVDLYSGHAGNEPLLVLVEALSDFDLTFAEWRFHHVRVVQRVLGDRSPGTAGSPGSAYLTRTLAYRFFPEIWDARNRIGSRD